MNKMNQKYVFLDHNRTISIMYKDSNGMYSLKKDIFKYERKEYHPDRECNLNANTKSKKRKSKKTKMSSVLNLEKVDENLLQQYKLEIQHLRHLLQEFNSNGNLGQSLFVNQTDIVANICTEFPENEQKEEQFKSNSEIEVKSVVEEVNTPKSKPNQDEVVSFEEIVNNSYKFSKFHGSNQTEYLQKISMNNHTFLIPPKCNFYNYNVGDLSTIKLDQKFDFIIMDPPWRNKFIRRLKKSLYKNSSAYEMLSNNDIQEIPIQDLIHKNSLVAIWCTNSRQNQYSITNEFYSKWNLKFLAKVYWMKMTVNGKTICDINDEYGKKQPYEILYIASAATNCSKNLDKLRDLNGSCIFSIPSLIHSHKPPILQYFKEFLSEDENKDLQCLEIFARYLQPNFTSIGLEVLKLMDERLYDFQ